MKYGTIDNFLNCDKRGLRAHMPPLTDAQNNKGRRKGNSRVKAEPEKRPRPFVKVANRLKRTVQTVLLAIVADIAFVSVEVAAGLNPLVEFSQHPWLYFYIFLGTIFVFGVFGSIIGRREDVLEKMAFSDPLTGLFNSRHLWARINDEFALAVRHRTPMSLVLFDLDNLKKVNDHHGHPVGDHFLQLVGLTIQSMMREGEIAARVGGEEFALLLPHASAGEATIVAERICIAIGQKRIMVNGNELGVTVSAGVACTLDHEGQSAEAVYRLADQALLQAKREGRNRVIAARII